MPFCILAPTPFEELLDLQFLLIVLAVLFRNFLQFILITLYDQISANSDSYNATDTPQPKHL